MLTLNKQLMMAANESDVAGHVVSLGVFDFLLALSIPQ